MTKAQKLDKVIRMLAELEESTHMTYLGAIDQKHQAQRDGDDHRARTWEKLQDVKYHQLDMLDTIKSRVVVIWNEK